jgi:ACS family hexuronate transporter-like MFS transporter
MKVRWGIAFLVSAAVAISYLDRQTLPVAVAAIQRDIPISDEQYSHLTTAFLVTYGFMYAFGGRCLDWLGTRAGFTIVMLFWSLACAAHGLVSSLAMLGVCRLCLGAGEGGGFPAATRVVAEWFPAEERSTAMGIMNGGSAIGLIIAPPLIALILTLLSWRWIFFITGSAGLLWTVLWRRIYFPAAEHPRLAPAERFELQSVIQRGGPREPCPSWMALFNYRETWALVIAKFLSDAAWYFFLFWLPKYLYDARGFDIRKVGAFAWIPPAAAGLGCLCGGWWSGWLLRRNWPLDRARKAALGASAILLPVVFLIPRSPVGWMIAFFSVAYFGQQSWSTLVMSLPADMFPRKAVGSVAGLVGFGGAIGGVVFGEVAGWLLGHGHGWGVVFAMAGSLHVIAFLIICLAVPSIQPLNFGSETIEPSTAAA